ncbi:hypothetical protein [Stenotrophomonas sp. GD03657]|uniref:hypothetical protein n=1 Tax=Stenotrophomonas sp. GD03657 TaxID=2975363 RepID=UPI0024489F30|nr:hypothetical protein [Stenotrophomonas sp. GD03657]MDH2154179.1 hypothetical protein [Stenotrophomonas sp. GD03657]
MNDRITTEIRLDTMYTRAKGNTPSFLEAITPKVRAGISALNNIQKKIDRRLEKGLPILDDNLMEIAFIVAEEGVALWTGTINRNQAVLRSGDKVWSVKPGRASFVDGHGNSHEYRWAIVHDSESRFNCKEGWGLVETRVHQKVPNADMPDRPYGAMLKLIEVLNGTTNLGSRVSESAEILKERGVSDFIKPIQNWVDKMRQAGTFHEEYRDRNLAGMSWFEIMELMYYRDRDGSDEKFVGKFMVELLLLVEHSDSHLRSRIYSQLRRSMNSLGRPGGLSEVPTVYTMGPAIFERAAAVRAERAELYKVIEHK